jgi:hypothetical protein
MFKVRQKKSGKVLTVYIARNDCEGFVEFLTYVNGEWGWHLSLHYEPIE